MVFFLGVGSGSFLDVNLGLEEFGAGNHHDFQRNGVGKGVGVPEEFLVEQLITAFIDILEGERVAISEVGEGEGEMTGGIAQCGVVVAGGFDGDTGEGLAAFVWLSGGAVVAFLRLCGDGLWQEEE